jgi:hypothetical protein
MGWHFPSLLTSSSPDAECGLIYRTAQKKVEKEKPRRPTTCFSHQAIDVLLHSATSSARDFVGGRRGDIYCTSQDREAGDRGWLLLGHTATKMVKQ